MASHSLLRYHTPLTDNLKERHVPEKHRKGRSVIPHEKMISRLLVTKMCNVLAVFTKSNFSVFEKGWQSISKKLSRKI